MKRSIFVLLILILAAAKFEAAAKPSDFQIAVKTPNAAARGFYQAWNARNRKRAQTFARREAIEKLFGARQQKMTFKGCARREEGDYECLFESKRIDLTIAMIVKTYRAGYRVAEVSFSSEAI